MSPSEVERHPAGYLWSQLFPDHEEVLLVEGGAVYAAHGENAFWVIMDEGTLADFPDDAGDLGTLITLERFDDEAAWLARIASYFTRRLNYLDKFVKSCDEILEGRMIKQKLICTRYTDELPRLDHRDVKQFRNAMDGYRQACSLALQAAR